MLTGKKHMINISLNVINVGSLYTNSHSELLMYPCTARGCMYLLQKYFSSLKFEGLNAVVIGRSIIAGRPIAQMLLNSNATVTVCHSKTANIQDHVRGNFEIINILIAQKCRYSCISYW